MNKTLSEAERKALHQGVLKAKRFGEFWQDHAHQLMEEYGGEWVLFVGTEVIAHDGDPANLDPAIARLGPERADMIVHYVPRPSERFAL